MKKRAHGDGGIEPRGDAWRLRYRADGKRFTKTFHGTEAEARKELARLTTAVNSGHHVAPAKTKLSDWIEQWLEAGAPGRRKKRVGHRALERYAELLRCLSCPRSVPGRCSRSSRPRSTRSMPKLNGAAQRRQRIIARRSGRMSWYRGTERATSQQPGRKGRCPLCR